MRVNILFTLDEGYAAPLKVLLQSLCDVHEVGSFDFYIIHKELTGKTLQEIEELVNEYGNRLHVYDVSEDIAKIQDTAKTTRHYTWEMYLWLFAPYLIKKVDRILYLDPDIICMNDISELYTTELEEGWFAAASYDFKNNFIQVFNNLRLGNLTATKYYNTGVVLMDLAKLREETDQQVVIDTITKKKNRLVLPDQDIFNYLYEDRTKRVDWKIYNMDPRVFEVLHILLPDEYNHGWVRENITFIHYCADSKPWIMREEYPYILGEYWFDAEKRLLEKKDTKKII